MAFGRLKSSLGSLAGGLLGGRGSDSRFLLSRGAVDFSARILGVAMTFGWTLILVRLLGPTEYGRFVYLMSATFFLSLLGSLGMPVVASFCVQRYVQRRAPRRLAAFLLFAATTAVLGPMAASLMLWGAVHLAGGTMFDGFSLPLVLVFSAGAALVQLFLSVDRALERNTIGAYSEQVTQRLLALGVIALLLALGLPADGQVALAGSVAGALGAAVIMAGAAVGPLRRMAAPPPARRMLPRLAPHWLRRAAVMMVTPVFFLVVSETDILMLGVFAPPALVGTYHVARRVAQFMRFPQMAVVAVGTHRFAAAHMARDTERLQGLVDRMNLLGAVPALGMWLVLLPFGPVLLGLFGPGMAAGYAVLLLLASATLLETLMGPATELLMMTGHERAVSRINFLFAGLNVALNAVLVPQMQMEGAALATAIAVFGWKLTLARMARRRLGVITALRPAAFRGLLSAAAVSGNARGEG